VQKYLVLFVYFWVTLLSVQPSLSDEASQRLAQETITNQIEAFKSGNDVRAFSFASPRVSKFFPDVSSFMDMVKRGYQPVYQPQSYSFGRSRELEDGQLVQEVLVTGPDGKPWTAIYTMVKMTTGEWLINGVQIVPGDDSSA
jgi:Domain of unknown function (DUF4864)